MRRHVVWAIFREVTTPWTSHLQFDCLHVEAEKKTGGEAGVWPHNRRDQSRTCVLQPILVIIDAYSK